MKVKTLSGEIKEMRAGQATTGIGFTEITFTADDIESARQPGFCDWFDAMILTRLCEAEEKADLKN